MGYIELIENGDVATIGQNFVFGIIIMMVYIQGLIFLMEKLVKSGKLSSDLSRKVIHIAAGSFIWVWLFMDTSDGWSYAFNITVPLLFSSRSCIRGSRSKKAQTIKMSSQ
ncbi:MAG: hypothetical protein ACXAEI_15600 [Candidatus Hodarchaeales archaeon]|jgi:hypothetical protein